MQEINIVTLDDRLSGVERPSSVDNRPLSCSASVSTASIRNISIKQLDFNNLIGLKGHYLP
jgi:hypothetical protein